LTLNLLLPLTLNLLLPLALSLLPLPSGLLHLGALFP
jgi:hypothetical protein